MQSAVPDLDAIGQRAEPHLADQFKREIANLLGRTSLSFPGAQPVSFARRHIEELQREDYYVVEKTDGIRCLMYFTRGDQPTDEIHYLIDRKNNYYYVGGLHFPIPGDETFMKFHVDTLIDGELVNDTYEDGTQQLKFYVFDCLVLDGKNLTHRTLDKRLAYFKENLLKPYNELYKKYPEDVPYLAFILEDKSIQFSYGIEMMFREIIPKVKKLHGNDGLIFTCRSTPYKIGTDEHILKWKPPNENTIDFRMRLDFPLVEPDSEDEAEGVTEPYPDYDAIPTCHLFTMHNNNVYEPFALMHLEESEWEDLKALQKPLDDTVVECFLDEQKRWRFMRFRDDKPDANHISTVKSVLESIEDRVSEEDLIKAAPAIKAAWKRRQVTAYEESRKKRLETRPNGAGATKRKFGE